MGYTIAKYIRLSIDDAKNESLSIENQHLIIDRHIAAITEDRDITILEFIDNGYSGTNFERPAIQELLELVRMGRINCIIVKDFSRFGRNMIEAGYFLQMVFPLFQTRFISISDAFDSLAHDGDTVGLEFAFKLLISEYYSKDLSRKIKSSRHAKALRGEYIIKNCAFGYMKVGNHLEIDKVAAKTVRLIFDMAKDGQSFAEIAARLYADKYPTPSEHKRGQVLDCTCIWNKSQILTILSDEQYIGTYIAGKTKILEVGSKKVLRVPESEWIKIPDHHPAIIDKTLFAAAREKIEQKRRPIRNRKIGTWQQYRNIRSPLQGKVFCGQCGHTLKLSNTKNAAFHCDYTRAAPDAPCYRLKILEASLSEMILDMIRQRVPLNSAGTVSEITLRSQSEHEYERLILKCRKGKRTLYERFVGGELTVDEYKHDKAAMDAESDRLSAAYSALKKAIAARSLDKQLRETMDEALSENKLTAPLVELLIDKVLIHTGGQIDIQWNPHVFVDAEVS